jgi:hypothetical protein
MPELEFDKRLPIVYNAQSVGGFRLAAFSVKLGIQRLITNEVRARVVCPAIPPSLDSSFIATRAVGGGAVRGNPVLKRQGNLIDRRRRR